MPPTNSNSTSTSDSTRQANTATSGENATAFASSPYSTQDGGGGKWISASSSRTAADGTTITEKVFGKQDNSSDPNDPRSTWQWMTGSGNGEDSSDNNGAEANTGGGGAVASSGNGKASAGIVDGKAVAMAG